jgi:hypothetical protein
MGEQRMSNADHTTDAIEMRLVRALETKPEVRVPDGFAARVAGRVPARVAEPATPARYGVLAMRMAMAVLVVALVAVALRSAGHSAIGVAVEWILCGQLAALAIWRSGVWGRGSSGA